MNPRSNFRLSPEQAADARAALAILDGSGLSLTDAARMAKGGGARIDFEAVTVSEGCDRFLVRCLNRVEQGSMRRGTYRFYEDALSLFAATYRDKPLGSFTRPELRKHFESLPVSPSRQHGRWRAVRAMFRFGLRQEPRWFANDPTEGLELESQPSRKTIEFLSVEQAAKIMAQCTRYRAALALVLFGGVRIEEVAGRDGKPWLRWRHIDLEERQIRIPAEIAKTGRPRIQEDLPENLWAWLEADAGKPDENISPASAHSISVAAKSALGTWRQNYHRHSFATYHLAGFGDAGKTSMLLGHEGKPALLFTCYRGLATRSESRNYFAIIPP
jgi:integrase